MEENENHAHQSQAFITTVSNNYNGIGIPTETNSCYRKIIIFYLNSNATRITWQQHTSVETMSVFDEENTLAPNVMDGHLNSIQKEQRNIKTYSLPSGYRRGPSCSPQVEAKGANSSSLLCCKDGFYRARANTEGEARAGWASLMRKEAQRKGFPLPPWSNLIILSVILMFLNTKFFLFFACNCGL